MKQNFYTDQHITHPTITDMRVTKKKKNIFFTKFKFKPQGSTLREAEGTVVPIGQDVKELRTHVAWGFESPGVGRRRLPHLGSTVSSNTAWLLQDPKN